MQDMSEVKSRGGESFPFSISDLVSWTVRRMDGTVATFKLAESAKEGLTLPAKRTGMGGGPLVRAEEVAIKYPATATSTSASRVTSHLSEWCTHTPSLARPLAEFDGDERGKMDGMLYENPAMRLYVGDFYGAKQAKDNFDFIIDGGDVISLYGSRPSGILEGDPELTLALRGFTCSEAEPKVLKIAWGDRKAPDVIPQFWVELNKHLYGEVMTCCQGGHGRSGTAFVCLLMVNTPDYDARDAILHLRAMHCPRAIESVVQHDYINDVAKFLGREPNALKVKEIKDYKIAFTESERPSAVRMKKILGWGAKGEGK